MQVQLQDNFNCRGLTRLFVHFAREVYWLLGAQHNPLAWQSWAKKMQEKLLVFFALIICLKVANALEINHIYRNKRGNYQNTRSYLISGEIMTQSWQTLKASCIQMSCLTSFTSRLCTYPQGKSAQSSRSREEEKEPLQGRHQLWGLQHHEEVEAGGRHGRVLQQQVARTRAGL